MEEKKELEKTLSKGKFSKFRYYYCDC